MAEPIDMIVPLLREMRAENATLHQQTRQLIEVLDRRLGKVEEAQTSCRPALSADSLLSRLVTREFQERIEAPRKKVRDLETLK